MHPPDRISRSVSELVGDTPLLAVPLRAAGRLLLKLEAFNPGRSMKDRMARSMVLDAERSGRLGPGGTIVESTSGNTGTGLALIAAERGYRFVAVVDHHASKDKLRVMRAFGAELVFVGTAEDEDRVATAAREAHAEHLEGTIEGAVWLRQADNPANADGYVGLARELLTATGGEIDVLVGAVGTGGSLCGTARALRASLDRPLEVVGVEPVGSIIFGGTPGPYFQSGTGTPEGVEIGGNVDLAQIDAGVKVSDRVAFNTARWLARRFGVLVGGSSGGVVHEALRRSAATTGTVIAITCDAGEKYLDTVFDDDWMARRDLLDARIAEELDPLVRPR
ncbi:MAG: cysteine synthase family protein [Polyangiales bacterium]